MTSVLSVNGSRFLTVDGDGSPRTYRMREGESAEDTMLRVRSDYEAALKRFAKWIDNIDAALEHERNKT